MGIQKTTTKIRLANTGRVLLFYLCSLVIIMFTSGLTKHLPRPAGDLTSMTAAVLLSLAITMIFVRWNNYRPGDVGLAPGNLTSRRFAAGFLIGLLMAVVQAAGVAVFGHLKLVYTGNITLAGIAPSILLYLLVACREELVFRGYSLRTMNNTYSSVIAVTFMVVIFVLEHILAGMPIKTAVIGPGLGGVLFSIAALRTKGLALPLGIHFSWNFGQWLVGFKDSTGVFNALVEKGYETSTENLSLGIYVGVLSLAIAGITLAYKRETN